jgi:PE-PPE domain-containing protein
MRATWRSVVVIVLALVSTVVIGFASTITTALTLAATALIVPGTGTPNANIVAGYMQNARDYYMTTTPCVGSGCTLIGINYPASFWPIPIDNWCPGLTCDMWNVSVGTGVTNLNTALINQLVNNPTEPVVIFGYSQGAAVASLEKTSLANLDPALKKLISVVLIGNIERPNGGLWERLAVFGTTTIPILDVTIGLPTPTNTGITTTDIAFQYDGVADFPLYAGNILADLNAIAGFQYIHGTYLEPNQNSGFTGLPDGYTPAELADQMNPALHPENFAYYGDTTYITIPTRTLPIARPFLDLAAATGTTPIVQPLVDLVSPTLRVLIDLGYDRSINPGIPTPLSILPFNPFTNPITLTADLVNAVVTGISDALKDIGVTPPIAPTPLSPTPLAPTPLAPTPLAPTPLAPTPTPLSTPSILAAANTVETHPTTTVAPKPASDPAATTVSTSTATTSTTTTLTTTTSTGAKTTTETASPKPATDESTQAKPATDTAAKPEHPDRSTKAGPQPVKLNKRTPSLTAKPGAVLEPTTTTSGNAGSPTTVGATTSTGSTTSGTSSTSTSSSSGTSSSGSAG